jgi:CBS domain-containing protein
MPILRDVLGLKGSHIHTIDASATVLEATQKMNEFKIGALVVMSEGQVAGIFTERDVLQRVVADEKSPSEVTVGEVMTADVICAPPDADLEDASAIMKNRRIRHLPVCDEDGSLKGMISIGDVNATFASTQEQEIHFLRDYIYGRV